MIVMYLIHASPVLWVQVHFPVDAHPRAGLTAAVPEYVLAALHELDLRVPLAQLRTLYVHGQVDRVRVARAEELPIGRRVDVQKLPRKDPVCTLQEVVVVASFT